MCVCVCVCMCESVCKKERDGSLLLPLEICLYIDYSPEIRFNHVCTTYQAGSSQLSVGLCVRV